MRVRAMILVAGLALLGVVRPSTSQGTATLTTQDYIDIQQLYARYNHAIDGGDAAPALRVGTGYDLHRLVEGRPLILGGVTIPYERGLLGHSDADVVRHDLVRRIVSAYEAAHAGAPVQK